MSKTYIIGETKETRRLRKRLEKSLKTNNITKPVVSAPLVVETPVTVFDNSKNEELKNSCFVLGNGVSRASISPMQLKNYGKIYGCNALYREFRPDHLVAVDTKMIREITTAGYHRDNQVWTNPNKFSREISGLNLFQPNLGWSSGPSALNLASTHSYSTIYILGFDYIGIGRKQELVNNVYAGTINYKKENERSTYYGNWSRQTGICIRKFPKIKYIRIVENINSFIPEHLIGIENLTHITLENFKKRFNLE